MGVEGAGCRVDALWEGEGGGRGGHCYWRVALIGESKREDRIEIGREEDRIEGRWRRGTGIRGRGGGEKR